MINYYKLLILIIIFIEGGEQMRFAVTYRVEQIPISYRMKIYGLIKEAVKRSDANYYQKVFEQQRRDIPPFSIATYLKDYSYKQDIIQLRELTITISAELEFAIHAFNGLLKLHTYSVDGHTWTKVNARMINEAEIKSSSVLFKTLSPILIEDKQGKPLAPDDENYEEELNYYVSLQVKRFLKRNLHEAIKFTPLNMKRVVIKERNQDFNKMMKPQDYLFYTTYQGLFKLEGHPEDLQILYQYGLGRRTAFFGLLQLEREEV